MTSLDRAAGDTAAPSDIGVRWTWILAGLIWLACMAMMVTMAWKNITLGTFNDPDDAMRLVEVRDWMAGQSWFDVTQYRSQPPMGAPMHWSRLVDLPIAGLIAIASLVLPVAGAELVALVAVPLILFSILFLILYRLTVELSGRRTVGLLALALLSVTIGTVLQFYPTRIDHHGWQIMLGALGVLLMLQALKGVKHRAMLAGVAMAFALEVAIEGLPLAVAIGAVFAVWHWCKGGKGDLLLTYLMTLTGGAALLPLVMLGWPAAAVPWCDALSPAYLWPMVVAVVLLAGLLRLIPQERGLARLATLAIAGAGAAIVFRAATPLCAAGPFATLDPLVYKLWYLSVLEGLPVWKQTQDVQVMQMVPSLLGVVAALWAIRRDDAQRRDLWIAMLIVQAVTCLVSIMVMRAMGLAHLLALPACGWLFVHLFARSRHRLTPAGRVVAGALCVLATPIGLEAVVLAAIPETPETAADIAGRRRSHCLSPATLRGLAAMPRTTVFAPLDISPHLLAFTPHTYIGTGHHRARLGMKTVMSAFTSPPDQARGIMVGTGATLLALCASENEVQKYAKLYPASITAALMKGRTPGWLQSVPMRRGESIRVYRILPLAPKPAI